MIAFFCSSSARTSIKNLKAAACICKVAAGSSKDTSTVIKSYVPYSAFVKYAVNKGKVIKDANFGKKVPNDIINVFFANLPSLDIYTAPIGS